MLAAGQVAVVKAALPVLFALLAGLAAVGNTHQ